MCSMTRIMGGLVVAACAASAAAQDVCPGDVIKLLASDGQAYDRFGRSVAISGDTAIVGAWNDDDRGTDSGSAYVYEWDGLFWNEVAKLTAPDGAERDNFGISVAISGETAIIGAWNDDDHGSDSGSAYVFQRLGGSWFFTHKLLASDGGASDIFGNAVSISGDTAIVGAPFDDDLGSDSGSVYVFERVGNAWTQTAKLTAADGAAGDNFGISVAISGDTAIVGAFRDDDLGTESGSAYVFERVGNAWTQAAKITADDGAADDNFGISVAISGDTAVVGAYGNDDRGTDAGSAYVYPDLIFIECCADTDQNGVLDAADFFLFLDLFAAGDSRADFTDDGVIDGGDFFVYLDAFAAGCP